MKNHYAIIGMAHVAEDYPLYFDAMNEKGVLTILIRSRSSRTSTKEEH